jgi:hypothetical protein
MGGFFGAAGGGSFEQGIGLFKGRAHPTAGEDLAGVLQDLGGLARTGELQQASAVPSSAKPCSGTTPKRSQREAASA